MFTNVVLGAISIAALIPAAHAATAQVPHENLSPTALPSMNIDQVKVIHRMVVTQPRHYTVRPGDTLSGISAQIYNNASYWPRLYAANKSVVGPNPNVIHPGQQISETLADKPEYGTAVAAVARARSVVHENRRLSSGKVWGVTYGYPNKCGDGDDDGWDVKCSTVSTSPSGNVTVHRNVSSASSSGGWPGGSYGACVVARESGGNSQVMNSSGHYGLYQFSASTWAAYGGNPNTFGHASIAEQESVFMNAMAQGGQSNWSPYDGC